MAAAGNRRLGLIVRSAPFRGRSGRDQLDIALAAAAMNYELELLFLGAGEFHLLPGQERDMAALPAGARAWASLPELTRVRAWLTPGAEQRLGRPLDRLLLPCAAAEGPVLARRLGRCDRILVV